MDERQVPTNGTTNNRGQQVPISGRYLSILTIVGRAFLKIAKYLEPTIGSNMSDVSMSWPASCTCRAHV